VGVGLKEIINNPAKSPLMVDIGKSPSHNLICFHAKSSISGDLMHHFIKEVCSIVIVARFKQMPCMHLITKDEKSFLIT
jgi:hypothetical protein